MLTQLYTWTWFIFFSILHLDGKVQKKKKCVESVPIILGLNQFKPSSFLIEKSTSMDLNENLINIFIE